mmetsp:Transcript_26712/g.55465  ORF Transcript_26712/g.55465 Transcript_26712/m.55465 type:complete len:167 (-) Transcript_26712:134-634(-)
MVKVRRGKDRPRGPFLIRRSRKPNRHANETEDQLQQRKAKKEAKRLAEQEEKARKEQLAEEARNRGPSKKEQKRLKKREYLLRDGKIIQTNENVHTLMRRVKKQGEDSVAYALVNCQDEAELRNAFAYDGTAGGGSKYFAMSRFKFRFCLAKDGTPVAQILEKAFL